MANAANYHRILFTGATGFVGRYLAPAIAEEFPLAKRLILRRHGDLATREGWNTVDVDMLDSAAVDVAIADFRPDLVLHFAAQASVGSSAGEAEFTWKVNFDGSLTLGAACARHVPDATLLFASSAEVYGWSFLDGPAREDTALKPASVYGRSKAAAEAMLADVLAPQARLIVTRAFNHTGPFQDERFVLPAFAAQIAAIEAGRKDPRLQVGNLEAARDFLDVRDVCAAYLSLLRTAPELPLRGAFNIGSGHARKIRAIVEQLSGLSRRQFEIAVDPARLRASDIPIAAGASDRLFAATGWQPKIPFDDMLLALLNYWRNGVSEP